MLKRTASIAFIFIISGLAAEAGATAGNPRMPFWFVENRGQFDPAVRYMGNGPDFKAWFQDQAVILRRGDATVKIAFVRGSVPQQVRIEPDRPTGAKASYLLGSNPDEWRTGLPQFEAIHYSGVWPGVELTYGAIRGHLTAEYKLSPRVDVGQIRLRPDAAAEIQKDGSLLIHTAGGDFAEEKPLLYQQVSGVERQVAGGFRKLPDGSVGFWAGGYDTALPLLIDPAILISGYFGGSSEDNVTAVAVDNLNNIVVAGWTSSGNLPVSGGALQKKYAGSVDAFVASFLPNGGGLNYCTYLGGSGEDQALGLAVDSSRNVYITGWTASANFPLASPIQARLSGTRDAFVTKLNASGSALVYSTYLGGSGSDTGYAIALNATLHYAIVVGDTTSTNFPLAVGAFQPVPGGSQDAFVAILSAAGNSLLMGSYLGGNGVDHASSVAVDPVSGRIFVGGYTWSANFPVASGFQPHSGGGQDGFVAKITPFGTGLAWSTYLGGSGGSVGAPEEVTAVAVDSSSNVIVAGTTSSTNFPVSSGVFQTALAGETDGFITRFTAGGSLLESTYLGGALADTITGVAVDFYGDVYVTGSTSSLDFPVQWPIQAASAGSLDAFVVKMNSRLSSVTFGTYLGGSGSDQANGIAVDAETSIIVAGQTSSPNYPVTGIMQNFLPSVLTSFITKIRPNFTLGAAYSNASQIEFTADPWHVMTDTASTFFGLSTDIPVVGDWTGTGVKRVGIFRNGTWILDTNGNGVIDPADKTVIFGQAGDLPVVGDWRGTGHVALGLYRQGTFILDLSGHLSGVPTGLSDATYSNFGLSTDIPIAADWSGSGTSKVGVFRSGTWLVDYNGVGIVSQTYTYGEAGDIPVVGDWDSSGNPPKIGVYRSGLWILNYSGSHVWGTPGLTEMLLGFGFPGYAPLVF